MLLGDCLTRPATPSLPLPPTPVGQFTAVATPTRLLHSGETLARKSAQMYEVPDPSERCTTVMSSAGSVTPAFSVAMAGSFHFVTLPRKMSASSGPENRSSPERPGTL